MFIGHFAPAFVAASHRHAPNLPTLFVAGQLVDWGFFAFALAGVERFRIIPGFTATNGMDLYDMPYTHSLLGSLIWAISFAALLYIWKRNWTGAVIGGAVVLSHWFLDLLVHAPDLTIAGGTTKYGFALWNQPVLEKALELGLIALSVGLYLRATKPKVGSSRFAASVTLIVMIAVQFWNWFGPQPTEANAEMSITALIAFGVFTLLSAWVAKSRMHILH
jgi:hypothetical protein